MPGGKPCPSLANPGVATAAVSWAWSLAILPLGLFCFALSYLVPWKNRFIEVVLGRRPLRLIFRPPRSAFIRTHGSVRIYPSM